MIEFHLDKGRNYTLDHLDFVIHRYHLYMPIDQSNTAVVVTLLVTMKVDLMVQLLVS